MRTLYRLSIIYIALGLSSCAAVSSTSIPSKETSEVAKPSTTRCAKNPLTVTIHKKTSQLEKTYTIVGQQSISKYNRSGIKRQEAYIRDTMRELAAAMGGDAVIDVKHDGKTITGTVVAFQKEPAEPVKKAL